MFIVFVSFLIACDCLDEVSNYTICSNFSSSDHPRYVLANAGCKHFDAYSGPENIPQSRFSFNAQVS
jgi:hypothetical protein